MQVSHATAKEKCANKNMSLLSTETSAEKDLIANFIAQNGDKYLLSYFVFLFINIFAKA
jgi:hypothetical protein